MSALNVPLLPLHLGACLLTLLGMGACSPALNWREFALDDSEGLSVRFPCKPDRAERPLNWPGTGAPLLVRMDHCEADGKTWVLQSAMVGSVDQVTPILSAWPEVLNSNLQHATHATQGAVLSVRPPTLIQVPHMTPSPVAGSVDLMAGTVQDGADPRWRRVRAWHFSHGLRVYEAAVWSVEDHKPAQTSEDVTMPFFEGLKFPG